MADRSGDWLKQAQEEFLWAKDALASGRWALVCFTAQQVAEKSLKAVAIRRGAAQVRSHSVKDIARALVIDGELETMARMLDQYYITTRYPDAFYSGAPFEFFTESQARDALRFARAFLDHAESEMRSDG